MLSIQTAQHLLEAAGVAPDKRHFRESIYLDLAAAFAEDQFVGRDVRIGRDVIIAVEELDMRCIMINLHPDTAVASTAILKQVGQERGGAAGVYGRVRAEGTIRPGDVVELID